MGLSSEPHEPCLFIWRKDDLLLLLLLYVEDMMVASKCKGKPREVKNKLKETFEIKDTGEPWEFLGIRISREGEKDYDIESICIQRRNLNQTWL